jgi:phosphoesterase RecJ-like protein
MHHPVPVPFELIAFIKEGTQFLIVGHKEPDGDCIGSQLVLSSVLCRLGKKSILCSAGPFKRPEIMQYHNRFTANITDTDRSGASVIMVDCSAAYRTGAIAPLLEGLPTSIIDHHASGTHGASTLSAPVFLDPDAPSVTFMVYALIQAMGLEPTAEEAELLLFGLCTDTGFFRHVSDAGAPVFEYAAGLIRAGASPQRVFHAINGGRSLNSRIFLGRILSHAHSFFDGKLILTRECYEDTQHFGLENRDSDTLYQQLQSVDGVEVVVLIRQEDPQNCTIGFRSYGTIDVSKIAVQFGGGGHHNAAGASIHGTITDAWNNLSPVFEQLFTDANKAPEQTP